MSATFSAIPLSFMYNINVIAFRKRATFICANY